MKRLYWMTPGMVLAVLCVFESATFAEEAPVCAQQALAEKNLQSLCDLNPALNLDVKRTGSTKNFGAVDMTYFVEPTTDSIMKNVTGFDFRGPNLSRQSLNKVYSVYSDAMGAGPHAVRSFTQQIEFLKT